MDRNVSDTEPGSKTLTKKPEEMQTGGAVALQCFSSGHHKNDRLNKQQLMLKQKPFFERKKIVDGDLDGDEAII